MFGKGRKALCLLTLLMSALMLAGCGRGCEKSRSHLERGDELLARGKYDLARVEYELALSEDGADLDTVRERLRKVDFLSGVAEIHIKCGIEYEKKNLHGEALEEYRRALRLDPLSLEAEKGIVRNLVWLGKFGEAIKTAEKLIGQGNAIPEAYFALAQSSYTEGADHLALKSALKALLLDPTYEPAIIMVCKLAEDFRTKRLEREKKARDKFLEGKIALKRKNYMDAMIAFKEVLETRSRRPKRAADEKSASESHPIIESYSEFGILWNLGLACEGKGFKQQAVFYFKKAVEISGISNPYFMYSLAERCENLGETEEALGLYLKIAEKDPEYGEVQAKLGYMYKLLGRYEESIEAFKNAIRQDRMNPVYYYNLGIMEKKNALYEDSRDSFSEVLRLLPENSDLFRRAKKQIEILEPLISSERNKKKKDKNI